MSIPSSGCPLAAAIMLRSANSCGIPSGILTPSACCSRSRSSMDQEGVFNEGERRWNFPCEGWTLRGVQAARSFPPGRHQGDGHRAMCGSCVRWPRTPGMALGSPLFTESERPGTGPGGTGSSTTGAGWTSRTGGRGNGTGGSDDPRKSGPSPGIFT